MESILDKFLSISLLFFVFNCSNNQGVRSFSFNYEVEIEPSDGNKIEVWLPYPISNEVQKIKNVEVDPGELEYQIKNELVHGNKYIYFYKLDGSDKESSIKLS